MTSPVCTACQRIHRIAWLAHIVLSISVSRSEPRLRRREATASMLPLIASANEDISRQQRLHGQHCAPFCGKRASGIWILEPSSGAGSRHASVCAQLPLYTCPHATIDVSAYHCIRACSLQHTAYLERERKRWRSSRERVCSASTMYVSACHCIRASSLPHTVLLHTWSASASGGGRQASVYRRACPRVACHRHRGGFGRDPKAAVSAAARL